MNRSIDEVASELVVLRSSGNATMYGRTEESERLTELYEEVCRRIGQENANALIERTQQVYDLLSPPSKS